MLCLIILTFKHEQSFWLVLKCMDDLQKKKTYKKKQKQKNHKGKNTKNPPKILMKVDIKGKYL